MRKISYLLIFICLTFVFALSVQATITSCGSVAASDVLGSDISGAGTCLSIDADNVTVDCQGFTITGDGTEYGINATGRDNITIKNCIIKSFERGIAFTSTNDSLVENNTLYNSSVGGFTCFTSTNNQVYRNTAYNNSDRGFDFYVCDMMNVSHNIAHDNSFYGIVALGSFFNLTNNTAYNNTDSGLVLGTVSSLVTNNTFFDNTRGIYLSVDVSSTIANNTFYDNSDGLFIQGSDYANITNNTAFNNARGFIIDKGGSTGNVFRNNLAYNNTLLGFSINTFKGTVDFTLFVNNTAYDNPTGFEATTTFTISAKSAHFNTFLNNTAYNGDTGFTASTGLASKNEFNGNLAYNFTSYAFYVATTEINLTNNTAYNSTIGFFLDGSSSIILANNTAISDSGDAISLSSSTDNNLTDNIGISTSGDGMHVSDSTLNVFAGNLFMSDTGDAINFIGGSLTNTFSNTKLRTNSTWILTDGASSDNSFENTLFDVPLSGSIRILPNATYPASTLAARSNLNVSLNLSFLNSTALPFFNTTAQIILRGIALLNPAPAVDFEDDNSFILCSAPQCVQISYDSGIYTMNVTSFTGYATLQLPVPSSGGSSGGGGGGNSVCPAYCKDSKYANVAICQWYPCKLLEKSTAPVQQAFSNKQFTSVPLPTEVPVVQQPVRVGQSAPTFQRVHEAPLTSPPIEISEKSYKIFYFVFIALAFAIIAGFAAFAHMHHKKR